jgi:hypothetical protein
VRTGEHGRCSNDHLSDSPQDGSQGRARYTGGLEESAENLSDHCTQPTGAEAWAEKTEGVAPIY